MPASVLCSPYVQGVCYLFQTNIVGKLKTRLRENFTVTQFLVTSIVPGRLQLIPFKNYIVKHTCLLKGRPYSAYAQVQMKATC